MCDPQSSGRCRAASVTYLLSEEHPIVFGEAMPWFYNPDRQGHSPNCRGTVELFTETRPKVPAILPGAMWLGLWSEKLGLNTYPNVIAPFPRLII